MSDWYKSAVFYQVFVRAFCDSNGDGIGDLNGVTSKLDYIRALGVNTIWLMPITPSLVATMQRETPNAQPISATLSGESRLRFNKSAIQRTL